MNKQNSQQIESTVGDINDNSMVNTVYDWVRTIIFTFIIAMVCSVFLLRIIKVDGGSMNDTLSDNDMVMVTDMLYTPHNGDIIVITHGEHYNKPIIKRVIATEGQKLTLDFQNERIIVDGEVLKENYIKGTTFSHNFADYEIPSEIPKGKVFVMGDNRPISKDSRKAEIGLIDVENIVGKAQFVAFPFNHFGYLY